MAPDRRRHRGPHPRDRELFAERHHAMLRQAVAEFSWLLTRGYPARAALKLVGDRYALVARQRQAILRCGCEDQSREHTGLSAVAPEQCAGHPVGIDGYNLLITLESALSGGLVLTGRDGRYRDLASVHGNYRSVRETDLALELLLETTGALNPSRVDIFLDQPVSNSGRLKTRLAELLEAFRWDGASEFNIELTPSPDRILKEYDGIVVTADSIVLRRCSRSLDMAALIIRARVPQAWVLDLGHPRPGDCDDDGTRW
ncbi:MAG: DUF434 domain-containing protein [Acidobacteria bacterium]|uniref:DUF434 domain-containing protein n=1 Tax=Candidatus Polarisedimenticola svalbardensis TaxID=2886004 RepID=A0A8J6XW56_9BACT|nr:DUF434 domain-containing protein [Candidatus Polarisedimenticola svalbardensis]